MTHDNYNDWAEETKEEDNGIIPRDVLSDILDSLSSLDRVTERLDTLSTLDASTEHGRISALTAFIACTESLASFTEWVLDEAGKLGDTSLEALGVRTLATVMGMSLKLDKAKDVPILTNDGLVSFEKYIISEEFGFDFTLTTVMAAPIIAEIESVQMLLGATISDSKGGL